MFEAQAQMLDYEMREQYDPHREYMIRNSKRKRYDQRDYYLEHVIAMWNNGAALDPRSAPVAAFLAEVCKRAIRASKGKFEGVHAQHKKRATAPRHG